MSIIIFVCKNCNQEIQTIPGFMGEWKAKCGFCGGQLEGCEALGHDILPNGRCHRCLYVETVKS